MTNAAHGADPADILLVEDNPDDVRLTREAFTDGQAANTLHVASDGDQALDFLYQRGDHEDAPRPDIVLLDLNLPRTDGDEVLAEIKADTDLKRIPVIILARSTAEADVIESYELRANAYVTKPADSAEFIATIRSVQEFWLSRARLPACDE